MLKMIIEEMKKEGITYDDCETMYEYHSVIDKLTSLLKKFGITDVDYEDYGFFGTLLMENEDSKTDKLKIPKLNKYIAHFKTIVTKHVTEYWELGVKAYRRNFVSDMIYNGDFSYYDGEFIDDDVTDSDTHDWEITDIVLQDRKLKESFDKKNKLSDEKKVKEELRRLNRMKLVIEERINLLQNF